MDFDKRKEYAAPFNKAEAAVWKKVGELCEQSLTGRFMGLPISLIAANTLEILRIFTIFGESAFKGVANIVASPCVEDAHVWQGFKQLGSLMAQATGIFFLPLLIIVKSIYYVASLMIFGAAFAFKKEKDCKDRLPKPKPQMIKKSPRKTMARDYFSFEDESLYSPPLGQQKPKALSQPLPTKKYLL